ncbi:MAG: hypothetical protein WC538_22085 [Thermoanaerobaculia bacterium]|jgi:hypothetical protein
MELLTRVLGSIIRRVVTGAAISLLAVMVAKGFLSENLSGEILAWIDGDAINWIVTILLTFLGVGMTWLDKYRQKFRLEVAALLPTTTDAAPDELAALARKLTVGDGAMLRWLKGVK